VIEWRCEVVIMTVVSDLLYFEIKYGGPFGLPFTAVSAASQLRYAGGSVSYA
jgi:hypothetical protein